ncbi:hypothetical protein COCSUDRAFT_59011 [Coccomyxa subellipsoidea C-169]|uniref:Uncharacterized protein n=1 Tax=Coccomyxa subellipsoidea (strain C-169) TaxID=574566 RepID=I0Z756_COCSC|nr:hypothetical protein COCSUDRAFT_59011 [Coccomyxa subellipsoidea C-169]EIE26475.1 hypothetical protein COCSUDRAFT_59011 [Coccomyxa subellipsoidea C-169]|eukprot:XP_005651019.1 hypothetical protein COCSUDRAFT_59011 [Coccomyxa subellipsoidea C-169]
MASAVGEGSGATAVEACAWPQPAAAIPRMRVLTTGADFRLCRLLRSGLTRMGSQNLNASRNVEQGADGWRSHAIQASAHAGQGVGQEEGQPLSQASEAARDDVRWAACGFEQGWDCSGPPMSQAIQEAKQ